MAVPVVIIMGMCLWVVVRDCSLLKYMLIVLGDDWRVSWLRGRHLLHGEQSELHWYFVTLACSSIRVLCAACSALTFQATAGATATSCAGVF